MPIFGGARRPRLDGFTREEAKRRNALNPEVRRRSGLGADEGQAAVTVLSEMMAREGADPLWPLLLGNQFMGMQRFGQAIDAFEEAVLRDAGEVRGHYGAGMACYRAAEYKRRYGDASDEDVAPGDLSTTSLYHEALRHFRRAMELTPDKKERDELATAVAIVERTLGRRRGRL